MMGLQLLYHGNCFDGMMSAAVFLRFYLERVQPGAQVSCRGMSHGRGDPYGPDHDAVFCGEHNAVVDFRYSPSPRLTWWCDHHQSAFIKPEHHGHFEADRTGRKCFDPRAPSCAGLLAGWLSRDHDFDVSNFTDHVHWADRIDSAAFDSPQQAVELKEPALQLMALLEAGPPASLVEELIHALGQEPIAAVHRMPQVQRLLGPVLDQQRYAIDVYRRCMDLNRGVAYFDLTDTDLEGYSKFVPYYLDGRVRYTVALTHSVSRSKISVGSNPWHRPEPLINLAELCGRYGGGGHAVVAGISMPPDELEHARRASLEIAEYLRR